MPSSQSQLDLAHEFGQIDLFQRLMQDAIDPDGTAQSILALKLIGRLWTQYREDRPKLILGESVLAVESETARAAWFCAIDAISSTSPRPDWQPFFAAIRLLRKMASPCPAVLRETSERQLRDDLELISMVTASIPQNIGSAPAAYLTSIAEQGRDVEVGAEQTRDEHCWAFNLVFAINPPVEQLGLNGVPSPGLLRRRCFRTDLDHATRLAAVSEQLVSSVDRHISDHYNAIKLMTAFGHSFSALRKTSRLREAWIILAGLHKVTARQLARGLGITEPGARDMLEKLVKARFAVHESPYFACSLRYRFRRTLAVANTFDE